jgi:hypothetical protein
VQREGAVVHVVADRLDDLSELLRSVEGRGGAVPQSPGGRPVPDGRGLRVPTRDFR